MGLLDPATSDGRVIFFLPWEGKTAKVLSWYCFLSFKIGMIILITVLFHYRKNHCWYNWFPDRSLLQSFTKGSRDSVYIKWNQTLPQCRCRWWVLEAALFMKILISCSLPQLLSTCFPLHSVFTVLVPSISSTSHFVPHRFYSSPFLASFSASHLSFPIPLLLPFFLSKLLLLSRFSFSHVIPLPSPPSFSLSFFPIRPFPFFLSTLHSIHFPFNSHLSSSFLKVWLSNSHVALSLILRSLTWTPTSALSYSQAWRCISSMEWH